MRRSVLATLALVTLAACGGSQKKLVGISDEPRSSRKAPLPGHPPPPVVSHLVARVTDGTLGPYLARSPNGGSLAVYASRLPNGGRQIVTVPLDDKLNPTAKPRLVATVAGEVDALVARSVASGYAIGWTIVGENGGSALRMFEVDASGIPRDEPFDVTRSDKDILWFEIVPTSRGAICAWAEQSSKTEATILTLALDDRGHARGVPSQAIRGVVGWQAVATQRGVALAARTAAGALSIREVDADAQPLGAAIVVTPKDAGDDFDVVRLESPGKKGAFALAWTDRSLPDPAVNAAFVEDGAPVKPAFRVSDDVGGASFSGIVGTGSTAYVAWTETGRRLSGGSRLHVDKIEAGAVSATSSVDTFGNVDLSADGSGVALLASVHACAANATDDACAKLPPAPSLVRYDASLKTTSITPVSVPEGETPALAWDVDCKAKGCGLLVASNEAPTPVFAFDASAAKPAARILPIAAPPPGAPRVAALRTVVAKEPIADFAVARLGDATVLATMAMAGDDPKSQPHAAGSVISVRALDKDGVATAPVTLTTRAIDLGGIAAASSDADATGTLVGWVAKDGADPQVHVARVDAHGKKLNELLVTTERGDAADVALAWAGNAWLVAWVDWRDGNGEVYVSRLAPDASRVLSTERITKAPGDASDVALLVPKGSADAWIAWADPREDPHEGFADIYVARVHLKDGKKAGDESRVLATAAHSRTPALVSARDGVAIAWIEEAPLGEGNADAHFGTTTASYGAMLARLDEKGHPIDEPMRTRGAGEGFPTSLALFSEDGIVHAAVARAQDDAVVLDLFDWPGAGPVRTHALAKLDGPPSMDVALALAGNVVYFDDEPPTTQNGERRVRKLTFEAKK